MFYKKKKLIISISIIIFLGFLWWFNTFTLTTTSITIKDDKIHDNIKIVQLTDLHGASFGLNNSNLISKIKDIDPNFITVTGDMYTSGDEKGKETSINLLKELAKLYPVYYVNGEHDNNQEYINTLSENNIKVLDYQTDDIKIGKTQLSLYGISNNYYSPTFNLANEFSINKDKYNILLAHNEHIDAFADFGTDLSICGDTHSGQVRLPFIGAIYYKGFWFPEMPENKSPLYIKGLYTKGNSSLFISSGLGNHPLPIRLFNRPKIGVINLAPSE